jgi:catechol 2,3-dioxygenase-like lactoylglutathione lyase family enzyme
VETDRSAAPAPAVHSLHCFAFCVPDLESARRFYEAFGLVVQQDGECLGLYTHGESHRWGMVLKGTAPKKRLAFLSFACFAEDLEALGTALPRRGLSAVAPHPLAPRGGYWLSGPDGVPIQILVAPKSSPDYQASPSIAPLIGCRTAVAPKRSQVHKVLPRRLSHVLLFSSDVLGAVDFYQRVLGLRLSDHSGDGIAFMHGIHGSDHHLIAIAKSTGPGLHHSSWDVGSIDEVGSGMEQMLAAGYKGGWGVGRHVLGSNYFYYVRDPWGSFCEYSYDIDYIPKGSSWPTANHAPEDSLYMWGPPVPPDFVTNHEVMESPS